jgi:hypothetical protein
MPPAPPALVPEPALPTLPLVPVPVWPAVEELPLVPVAAEPPAPLPLVPELVPVLPGVESSPLLLAPQAWLAAIKNVKAGNLK